MTDASRIAPKTHLLRYIPRFDQADACMKRWTEAEARTSRDGLFKCVLKILVGVDAAHVDFNTVKRETLASLEQCSPRWNSARVVPVPFPVENASTRRTVETLVDAVLEQVKEQRPNEDPNPRRTLLWWDGSLSEWTAAGSIMTSALEGVNWIDLPGGPWSPSVMRGLSHEVLSELMARRLNPNRLPKVLLGSSPAMQKVKRDIELFAPYEFPVLVLGETGTGKEMVAELLHNAAYPDDKPAGQFVPVNGALLSEQLGPADLFGYVKGAFTGADRDRGGRIEKAENGTFFLDELNSTPLSVQAKLLRAFQGVSNGEIEIEPVGADMHSKSERHRARKVRARMVTACQTVEGIREDLLHRVSDLVIVLPPLRERADDIDEIATAFIRSINSKPQGRRVSHGGPDRIMPDTFDKLKSHNWPGNVRELERTLRAAWVRALSENKTMILPRHIDLSALSRPVFSSGHGKSTSGATQSQHTASLRAEIASLVDRRVTDALERHGNNGAAAARELGFETRQKMEQFRNSMANKAKPRKNTETPK